MNTVSEHLDRVHNVVLIKCIFGSGKPQGVGILGKGSTWAIGRTKGVSLRATGSRGGRNPSQQEGFQVSEQGEQGEQGEQREQGEQGE
jgi:hypothetical protein